MIPTPIIEQIRKEAERMEKQADLLKVQAAKVQRMINSISQPKPRKKSFLQEAKEDNELYLEKKMRA